MAKNEVAVKQETALALASDFEQDAHSGFEGMGRKILLFPSYAC